LWDLGLPPYAVYSHSMAREPVELRHKYAISIVVDQDWKTAEATVGNDWISNSMSFLAYSTSGFIACILADYIRRLGYPARAHHARNYQVVLPPILLMAGIGEMSRIGDIVLNPFLGPRFKAAVVTTDLPLAIDQPIDFGLQDFCSKCGKCARYCPTGSISFGEKVIHNGYEKWENDVEKCTRGRVGNTKGSGWAVRSSLEQALHAVSPAGAVDYEEHSLGKALCCLGDDLLGHGQPKKENQWWLDLEEVDGKRPSRARQGSEETTSPGEEPRASHSHLSTRCQALRASCGHRETRRLLKKAWPSFQDRGCKHPMFIGPP
jgi:ferredoxin